VAWQTRYKKSFYYRTVRVGGRAKKVYVGGGLVGRAAAEEDARRRAERQASQAARAGQRATLEHAQRLARRFQRECELLAEAALLTSGFHRPSRHPWRKWHAATRALCEHARTRLGR
jgi:hypothetical protein